MADSITTTMDDEESIEMKLEVVASALDAAWLFVCLVLVILMQPGFAALEVRTYADNIVSLEWLVFLSLYTSTVCKTIYSSI